MIHTAEILFQTQIPNNRYLSLCLMKYGEKQFSTEWYDETTDTFYNPKYYTDLLLCYRDFQRILKKELNTYNQK
ncbi:hypothetical protein I4641_21920 [Waterburya agarophytonicola K14]|uniref:Uncharacterized protein n=1 Tax=Waterburya agarophytonicola KI4 TaxID=2874699 RepID=A0A964BWZ2_9CYAN|nr:hypothetical protein [Waterburya agarophytonicola]MCC0179618.1 hypothetical protein [Waterburya agarophytonicola KI4]